MSLLVSCCSFCCLGVGKGFRGENFLVSGNFSKKESLLESLTPRLLRHLVSKALNCLSLRFLCAHLACGSAAPFPPAHWMLIVLMLKGELTFDEKHNTTGEMIENKVNFMGSECLGWGWSCYSLFTWQPRLHEKYFFLTFNSPQLNFRCSKACKRAKILPVKFHAMCLWDSYASYFTGRYSLMNFCYLQKPFYTHTLIHILSLSLGAYLSHMMYVSQFHDHEIWGVRVYSRKCLLQTASYKTTGIAPWNLRNCQ